MMSSAGKLLRAKRMFIIIQTCWLVDGLAIREILSATILHTVNTTMCNMSVRKVFIRTKYVSSIIGTKLNFAIKLMKFRLNCIWKQ